jgi:aldehyde dehydrogenase (NAD+)
VGVVWVNSTNLFDAAAGFGGYRESGFGREGGREGMWEYVKASSGVRESGSARVKKVAKKSGSFASLRTTTPQSTVPAIDRKPKLFIGGKQARPDSGYSRWILAPDGSQIAEVPEGNRKDIRNAVEAAHAASKGWSKATGHNRAQILYYIAENLSARSSEMSARIERMTGVSAADARAEVEAAISRLFTYGAWADKWDGAVHNVPIRGVALAMNEPIGVIALGCPERFPLLGFVSLVGPAIAVGNTVVVTPSEAYPLAATDFYSVLETSDLPAGVVNIVTGAKDALIKTLAEHDDVEGVWYFGSADGVKAVELASASNMKRTWASADDRDWMSVSVGEGREFLRQACQVKNIWVPYGE